MHLKSDNKTEYSRLIELAILQFKWNVASSSEISSFSALLIDIITNNTISLHYVVKFLVKSAKPKIGEFSDIFILNTRFENMQQYNSYISNLLNKYPNKTSITGNEFHIVSELAKNHPSLRYTFNKIIGIYSNTTNTSLKSFIVALDDGTSIDLNYAQCLSNITLSSDIWRSKLCDIIVDIYRTFPNSHDIILNSLDENFPHHSFPLESHVSYLKIFISLSHLLNDSRLKLYRIVISELIRMDSETQNLQISPTDKGVPLKLDVLMTLLLQDLDFILKDPDFDSNAFVSEIFQILKHNIHTLSTSQSVQFIFIYISSLKPYYTEILLQNLFSILYDEAQLLDCRIAATGYIASLICRQQLLCDTFIIFTFEYLLKFLGKWSKRAKDNKHIPSNLIKSVFEACIRIIYFHADPVLTNIRKYEILRLFSSIIYGSLGTLLNCNIDLLEKAKLSIMRINGPNKMLRLLKYLGDRTEKGSNLQLLHLPFDSCNLVYTKYYLMLNSDPDLANTLSGKYISDFHIYQDLVVGNIEYDWESRSSDVPKKRFSKYGSSISKDVDGLGDFQLLRAGLTTSIFKPQSKSQLDYLLLSDAYKYSKTLYN